MPPTCQGRPKISGRNHKDDRTSLSKSTAAVSVITAASRLSGFVSIVVLAGALGNGLIADSYNLANTMPNMLFELLIGGVLTSVFVPVFVEQLLEDRRRAWQVASNFINVSTVFLLLVALVGTVFSFYFVRLQTFLVSSDSPRVEMASLFFKFFVWQIAFYGLTGIINGMLQSLRQFSVPAMAPVFNNIVVICTVLFVYLPLRVSHPRLAVYGLALGTTFGIAMMALVQIPALVRQGYRHRLVFDLKDATLRKLVVLALPILAYVASNQIAATVSNALAYQSAGGMTAFTYAWRFFQLPYGIVSVSIATVLFTGMSEAASQGNMAIFKARFRQGVRATGFVIIPLSVVMYLLSKPIIIVALRHGKFTGSGVEMTAGVLAFFVLGLMPFSMFILLTRMFYALKDSVTPMKVNALGVPLNIALDVVLVRYGIPGIMGPGVAGLSMGHTLTYTFTTVIMLIALRKRVGLLGIRELAWANLKFSLLSVAMAVAVVLSLSAAGLSAAGSFLSGAASIALGGAVAVAFYGAGSYLLRLPETQVVADIFSGIIKKAD